MGFVQKSVPAAQLDTAVDHWLDAHLPGDAGRRSAIRKR